jgi:hypothetical protein
MSASDWGTAHYATNRRLQGTVLVERALWPLFVEIDTTL